MCLCCWHLMKHIYGNYLTNNITLESCLIKMDMATVTSPTDLHFEDLTLACWCFGAISWIWIVGWNTNLSATVVIKLSAISTDLLTVSHNICLIT